MSPKEHIYTIIFILYSVTQVIYIINAVCVNHFLVFFVDYQVLRIIYILLLILGM